MSYKFCNKCSINKDISSFSLRIKNGKEGRQDWCKLCKKEYDTQAYKLNPKIDERNKIRRQEIREWYISLKKDLPCTDCGQVLHYVCMQWDHLPQYKKSIEVSKLIRKGVGKDTILEEIAKCELICANCHALRTYFRRQNKMGVQVSSPAFI